MLFKFVNMDFTIARRFCSDWMCRAFLTSAVIGVAAVVDDEEDEGCRGREYGFFCSLCV